MCVHNCAKEPGAVSYVRFPLGQQFCDVNSRIFIKIRTFSQNHNKLSTNSHSFYGVIAVENVWRIYQEMSWYRVWAAVAIVPAWDGESCTDGWQFTPINTLHYVSEVINRTNLDYMSFWSDVDRDFDRKHWKRSKLLPEWF